MDPLNLLALGPLMAATRGNSNITIGLIDGPVDLSHPAFQESVITSAKKSQIGACEGANSLACRHGTFIAGILSAKRGTYAPGMCPGCRLLLRPIFIDNMLPNNSKQYSDLSFPKSTPEELSEAIKEIVSAGAKIVNLSLGLSTSSLVRNPRLHEAYDYARKFGTIIVAASGNHGNIGSVSLLDDQWILPVAACGNNGRLDPSSNFGASIAYRGVMAPGINITSTLSGGGYAKMSGTSFAAPFVTGTLALLWSLFTNATPVELIHAVRSYPSRTPRRSIIPSLLNADAAWNSLKSLFRR